MADQSQMITDVMGWLDQARLIAQGWLLSPAAWSQFVSLTPEKRGFRRSKRSMKSTIGP